MVLSRKFWLYNVTSNLEPFMQIIRYDACNRYRVMNITGVKNQVIKKNAIRRYSVIVWNRNSYNFSDYKIYIIVIYFLITKETKVLIYLYVIPYMNMIIGNKSITTLYKIYYTKKLIFWKATRTVVIFKKLL